MAEAVISTIVETIGKQLSAVANEKIELACTFQVQLEKLKNSLSAIKSVLLDAEEQHAKNNEVRDWLGKLKDAVYDADDVLDEYEADDKQRQVLAYGSLLKKVCSFCSLSNPVLFHYQLGQKIKEIREKIDEILRTKSKFQFKERSLSEEVVMVKREKTYSFVSSLEVIGREDDKEKLINMLVSPCDDENVSIIPILGIGGLGKTTLAQLVYNDNGVVNYFHQRMWICVSEDFSAAMISRKIMAAFELANASSFSHLDVDLLQMLLRERLKTKRFLLVLDDVWNEDKVKWIY